MESRVRGSESIIACKRLRPPDGRVLVRGEDRHRIRGGGRIKSPPEQLTRRTVIEGGCMEEGLEGGAGLAFPEPAALDTAGGQAGAGGKPGGADHRGQWVLAPPDGRPPQSGGDAFGEVLRIEHGDRATASAGR